MKKNVDLFYFVMVLALLILDFLTSSEMVEALVFVAIVLGFALSVIPNRTNYRDERISYLKTMAGYIAFMIATIIVCLTLLAVRYLKFDIALAEGLRYLVLMMYLIYSLTYSILKRKA